MPALDSAELAVVSREIIDPMINDMTKKAPILWNVIAKGQGKDVNMRGVRIKAKVRRNPSMLWFSEGGKYARGGTARHIEMSVAYARFNISGRMTRDALEQPDAYTLINVWKDAVRADTETALKEFNQQLYGNGSGAKGIVASRDSATQVTFQAPFGSRQLLEEGVYNFYAGTARIGYVVGQLIGVISTLATKDTANRTGTFDAVPADVVAGDIITYEGSYGKVIKGLAYHIDNGTGDYQGKSRATYPELRALVIDGGGTTYLSVSMLYKLDFQARYLRDQDVGGLDDKIMVSSPTQANQYINLGGVASSGVTELPQGRYLDLGYKGFSFRGMTWLMDTDCPDDELYFLNPSKIDKYELKPLGIVPIGNEKGLAPVPAFDANGVGSYADAVFYALTGKFEIGTSDPALAGMRIKRLATGNGLSNGLF